MNVPTYAELAQRHRCARRVQLGRLRRGPGTRHGQLRRRRAGPRRGRSSAPERCSPWTTRSTRSTRRWPGPAACPATRSVSSHPEARDDVLREFYLQATTQVDGLRHRRASGHGFYNGIPDDDIARRHPGAGRPAMGREADRRPRLRRSTSKAGPAAAGTPLDHRRRVRPCRLELPRRGPARAAGPAAPGDLVLVHTGWADWFLGADRRPARGPRGAAQHRVPAEPRATGVAVGPPGRAVRHRHLRRRGASGRCPQPLPRHRRRRTPG